MKNKKKLKHVLEAIAETLYIYEENPEQVHIKLNNYFWSLPNKYWKEFYKKVSKKLIHKYKERYESIRDADKKAKQDLKEIKQLLNDNDDTND